MIPIKSSQRGKAIICDHEMLNRVQHDYRGGSSVTLNLFQGLMDIDISALDYGLREHKMKFETYGNCFVCGEKNPNGLRLNFEIDKERQTLKTVFVANPTFQGWDGIVHGGIISTLLDEATAKLVYELGYQAVTASLEIRFKKPAPILELLRVYGEITEVGKKLIRAKARVEKEDGTILATGIATFLKSSLAKVGSP
jgi:uncharacterized protein (TIGR00369 family)